jgi:hypothetical protein
VRPAWLDFHEGYAGYVEPLGGEAAVWGLAHRASHWYRPCAVSVATSLEPHAARFIARADVHGSYVYALGDTGFFRERAAESFDVSSSATRLAPSGSARTLRAAECSARATPPAGRHRGAEASDRFFRVHVGAGVTAVQDVDRARVVKAWIA